MPRLPAAVEPGGAIPRCDYDVIVFGGGPAGAAAARALARMGISVALFGKVHGNAPFIGETVAPEIVQVLAPLGVWDDFRAAGHASVPGTVVVWGDARPYENDFLFNPYGCGWHLDRARFDTMLLDAAAAAGAQVSADTVHDCARGDDGRWRVAVAGADDTRTLTARWAVDATGRAAWLGKRVGARRERVDRLVGLVRFVPDRAVADPRTLIESCREGWWYAAPLPESRLVVTFFTDSDLLPRGAQARTPFFDQALAGTRLIAGVVPAVPASSPLHTVAAWSGRLQPSAGANWLAIGDAAQSYDPLSGEGIAKAIASARRAADAIAAALSGRRTAIDDFVQATAIEYGKYLANRAAYYRREQRWPDHPFWQRRGARVRPIDRAIASAL